MKAVILIGGLGTRLRPLTCDTPKPLLPVLNRPFLHYQFEILRRHGVREAVLCTSYRPDAFKRALGDGRRLGLKIRYVHETTPLGTGGALKNAERFVDGTSLVLNGDVLNALDITAFLRQHRRRRAALSIALTRVKDPTVYGVVELTGEGRVKRFLEKPSWDEVTTNTVNAGAYLVEPEVLARIPAGVPHSLERGLFPQLLAEGRAVYGFVSPGYWIDIGTVEKFLQVHLDLLEGAGGAKPPAGRRQGRLLLGAGARLGKEVAVEAGAGLVLVGPRTTVADFARFTGRVSLGAGCRVGRGAWLEDCVVLDGAVVGPGARLERCVVGARARVGANAVLRAGTALAGASVVEPYSQL